MEGGYPLGQELQGVQQHLNYVVDRPDRKAVLDKMGMLWKQVPKLN